MKKRYRIEVLPNNLIRVDDRQSGLVGLYEADGTKRHSQLRPTSELLALIASVAS